METRLTDGQRPDVELLLDDFDYEGLLQRSGPAAEDGGAEARQVQEGFLQVRALVQNVPGVVNERQRQATASERARPKSS